MSYGSKVLQALLSSPVGSSRIFDGQFKIGGFCTEQVLRGDLPQNQLGKFKLQPHHNDNWLQIHLLLDTSILYCVCFKLR